MLARFSYQGNFFREPGELAVAKDPISLKLEPLNSWRQVSRECIGPHPKALCQRVRAKRLDFIGGRCARPILRPDVINIPGQEKRPAEFRLSPPAGGKIVVIIMTYVCEYFFQKMCANILPIRGSAQEQKLEGIFSRPEVPKTYFG
jgi:hypothetical protein